MTASLQAEIRGLPQLAAGTKDLVEGIEKEAPKALLTAAGTAAGMAKGRVPRLTGRLAGSISAKLVNDRAHLQYGNVPYAGWIEFGGTRGRAYVPTGRYLYPAAKAVEELAQRAAEQAADREIGAMHWPSPK